MNQEEHEDQMIMMDEFAKAAEMLAGFRMQLLAQGFTEEQAGELVVMMMRQAYSN